MGQQNYACLWSPGIANSFGLTRRTHSGRAGDGSAEGKGRASQL